MEILTVAPVMGLTAVTAIAFLVLISSVIVLGICYRLDTEIGMAIFGILTVISLLVTLVTAALPVETGRYTYTVEITDNAKYKELIENDYRFNKRLYDNKEIYEITGAPLEEIEK